MKASGSKARAPSLGGVGVGGGGGGGSSSSSAKKSWANIVVTTGAADVESELLGLAEESRDGINLFLKRAMKVKEEDVAGEQKQNSAMCWKTAISRSLETSYEERSSSDNSHITKKRLASDIAPTPSKSKPSNNGAVSSSEQQHQQQGQNAVADTQDECECESERSQNAEKKRRTMSWAPSPPIPKQKEDSAMSANKEKDERATLILRGGKAEKGDAEVAEKKENVMMETEVQPFDKKEKAQTAITSQAASVASGSLAESWNFTSMMTRRNMSWADAMDSDEEEAFFNADAPDKECEEENVSTDAPKTSFGDEDGEEKQDGSESKSNAKTKKRLPFQPIEELTEARLAKRQRQIDIGKSTDGYANYLSKVASENRAGRKNCPSTPDKTRAISKRSWLFEVRKWRRALHKWDPPSASSGEQSKSRSAGSGAKATKKKPKPACAPNTSCTDAFPALF